MFPRIYVAVVILGLAILGAVAMLPPPPFSTNPAHLSCLGRDILFDSKMAQVRAEPKYDVLTFGNSRILDVGEAELNIPGIRYFNFANGGTSFRQSVVALEQVARVGKAPKVAILSFDHPALVYAQLPYAWPLPPDRWKFLAEDFQGLLDGTHVVGPDWRKFRQRIFTEEVGALARLVNFFRLKNTLSAYFPSAGDDASCNLFRPDGSRGRTSLPHADLDGAAARPWPIYEDRYPLLEHDLDVLAGIQATGTAVVIYESPLYPAITTELNSRLPEEMARQRQRLMDGCRSRGLDCRPAPMIEGSDTEGHWPDATHAPPRLLGRWVAELVRAHLSTP
ncbi:hypothetical protein [Magnetospirillum aberrantis]|uniref:SGNH/GDSL hydrolase family protein n=1 Tax=Magnetospirillum aberrantis SpK TaxID=908842 RepID=A0A7C9US38_9PROT|nr:hypothetical protein [Magnetospirillum aberrantis]NFV79048.1 hypothetical protein [Magnetospirillum aberrantis SpK]